MITRQPKKRQGIKNRLRHCLRDMQNYLFPVNKTEQEIEKMATAGFRYRAELSNTKPHPLIHPLFNYRDPYVKTAIHLVKFNGRPAVIQKLGNILAEELPYIIKHYQMTNPLITPVPLAPKRLKKRGFNQSELLCREAEKNLADLKIEFDYQLIGKNKDTKPQTGLKRGQRLRNPRNVFYVLKPEVTAGRDIIVIDDVSTTGATGLEIIRTVKRTEAHQVIVVTLAH